MAIPKKELEFNKNDDEMRLKISALDRELAKISEGGGKKRVDKLHAAGKLT
ncbi:MAG: 3-methylcrotonyl-CoA carboxylase beta subunit, partial [Crocinitomicaceae bacterium]